MLTHVSAPEPESRAVARKGHVQRQRSLASSRCECGGIPGPDGLCAECRARRLGRRSVANDQLRQSGEHLGARGEAEEMRRPVATPSPTAPTPSPPSPSPPSPAPAAPPPCAHPINWTHTAAADNGPDGIQIPITWESSTGNLADLANCTVREVVTYDPIPNPPFNWNPPNPTILTVAATLGAGQDTHSYPPGLLNGISNPRQSGTAVAHQQYQFRCTGPGCSGNWENFPGQAYTITREVYPQFVRLNPWRYRITKDGVGNLFHYSREVAVPEPPAAPPPATPVGP
jgi:hypothetical protein